MKTSVVMSESPPLAASLPPIVPRESGNTLATACSPGVTRSGSGSRPGLNWRVHDPLPWYRLLARAAAPNRRVAAVRV